MARNPCPALALALLLLAPAGARASDDWWGRDKALHFSVTFAIGGGGYHLAGFAIEEPHWRAAAGAGLALVVGAGKELADASGSGDASARDMTWNAIGAAAGVLVGWGIDRLLLRPGRPQAPPGGDKVRGHGEEAVDDPQPGAVHRGQRRPGAHPLALVRALAE